jgi:diguanylate cyclase (GGDEF)-like protein
MRILLAEDDAISRRMVTAALTRWGYEVISCSDGEEAWRLLQEENAPRLAILDWMMPGLDGLEICRRVRSRETSPYTYIIMLTVKSRKQDLIEGLDVGADDYVSKPFNAQELKVRIRAGRRIVELQEQLRQQAAHDPLTGILNHNSIIEVLGKELSRARRDGKRIAAVMGDLDNFKVVNDSLGHLAGDSVLRQTAQRIRSSMRDYDEVGRFGGEEFLMILANADEQVAATVCERIREAVGSTPINTADGPANVTISLGVAFAGWETRRPEKLIRAADAALYRAKREGKDRVEIERPRFKLSEPIPLRVEVA